MKTVQKLRDETWLYDEDAEVAVPFELTLCDGEVLVEYYPSAEALACEFLHKFGADERLIFGADAVKWAYERFGAFLESHGFVPSPDMVDYYINYRLPESGTEILPCVRRLSGDEGYNDLTYTDIEGLCEAGYIIYAAVIGNDIAAVANTGLPITGDTPHDVEIGVDTAEKYRRKGYGRACVAALVRELSKRGYTAIYECASKNISSIRLAESLGGKVAYKKIYTVGFKDV